jgi:hypothetical protein
MPLTEPQVEAQLQLAGAASPDAPAHGARGTRPHTAA